MVGPPMKSYEELEEMNRAELIEYAKKRQEDAYTRWERMMGDDL